MAHYRIGFQLDSYTDLFSDFDPRPYSKRALSDDFLSEAKKLTLGREEDIDIEFLLPTKNRNSTQESIIRKRLLSHFHHHHTSLEAEKLKILRLGLLFLVSGIALMFAATFLLVSLQKGFLPRFGIILLEPASWFLFWEGLSLLLFRSKHKNPERRFYEKMHKARIFFKGQS